MTQEQGFPASIITRRVRSDKQGSWGYPPRFKPSQSELETLSRWFQERGLEEEFLSRCFDRGWDSEDPWELRAIMEIMQEEFVAEGRK